MLSLAIILTMVAVNIHHHHHGEQMYIALQENCEAGEHNGQPEKDNNVDHTQRFIAANVVKLTIQDSADYDFHNLHHFLSTPFIGYERSLPLVTITGRHTTPENPTALYRSADRPCRGLRAPPVC